MAYALNLAKRIREYLAGQPDLVEKKMFGGMGFLIQGNMACGVHGNDMIVRVGAENHAAALNQPYARPFDLTGKSMAGWVMVASEGCEDDRDLQAWVKRGVDFARSLPAK
jgi:TfoX/Sxy family transcriptional regulator of competence genes